MESDWARQFKQFVVTTIRDGQAFDVLSEYFGFDRGCRQIANSVLDLFLFLGNCRRAGLEIRFVATTGFCESFPAVIRLAIYRGLRINSSMGPRLLMARRPR